MANMTAEYGKGKTRTSFKHVLEIKGNFGSWSVRHNSPSCAELNHSFRIETEREREMKHYHQLSDHPIPRQPKTEPDEHLVIFQNWFSIKSETCLVADPRWESVWFTVACRMENRTTSRINVIPRDHQLSSCTMWNWRCFFELPTIMCMSHAPIGYPPHCSNTIN